MILDINLLIWIVYMHWKKYVRLSVMFILGVFYRLYNACYIGDILCILVMFSIKAIWKIRLEFDNLIVKFDKKFHIGNFPGLCQFSNQFNLDNLKWN